MFAHTLYGTGWQFTFTYQQISRRYVRFRPNCVISQRSGGAVLLCVVFQFTCVVRKISRHFWCDNACLWKLEATGPALTDQRATAHFSISDIVRKRNLYLWAWFCKQGPWRPVLTWGLKYILATPEGRWTPGMSNVTVHMSCDDL